MPIKGRDYEDLTCRGLWHQKGMRDASGTVRQGRWEEQRVLTLLFFGDYYLVISRFLLVSSGIQLLVLHFDAFFASSEEVVVSFLQTLKAQLDP